MAQAQTFTPLDGEIFFLAGTLLCTSLVVYGIVHYGRPYAIFAYECFVKPFLGGKGSQENQQDALESFYKGQAAIYDATRAKLLRGREEMLALAAAQIELKNKREGFRKRVWVDIGGGTGYNIEILNKYLSVTDTFSKVYLVDLSPSLCSVAEARFEKLGWENVKIVCMDARAFRLKNFGTESTADWISMSYSLSMIPDYYSVVDSLTKLLSPTGIISVADFYAQSSTNMSSRTYTGGIMGRHVNWFSRQFWRIWFEFDRVNLDEGRRDYLEYRFGSILSVNERNVFLGGIPYYIWIGCVKLATSSAEALAKIDAAATESPYLAPINKLQDIAPSSTATANTSAIQLRSKGFEAAVHNLTNNLPLPSFFYQNNSWRIYYDEMLRKHWQFNNSYIYAFTWEDPRVDQRVLKISPNDVVLAITSAGDNILSYILTGSPRRIHAVDLNPTQNHLLELKLAAFQALEYDDVWKIFGEGRHPDFRNLLINKLSPHLSSRAFQFWLDSELVLRSSNGLYGSGQSGIPIKTTKWLFRIFGITNDVKRMCAAPTINEQCEIWKAKIRPVILSWWVSRFIIGNEKFLWKALGVPVNQRNMILSDYYERQRGEEGKNSGIDRSGMAMWEYVVNTLDPVVENSLIGSENYFYLLCLQGCYSASSRPSYLDPKSFARLSIPGAFDGVRIHTDEIKEVIARMKPGTLTIAVVMDSMDWFYPTKPAAREQIRRLNIALKMGGRVLLRSAGQTPWYITVFEQEGFLAKRVGNRTPGACIDRVNMYASTWVCTKKRELNDEKRRSSVDKLKI
ncbi:hypothetical protein EDC01DRAFT_619620 [Geopyxis carbonaria]|nr:hypothetical protein EDC01DRAFT_619620 [Geopyxis carbonaria]